MQSLNTDIGADVSQYVPEVAAMMGGTITAMLGVGLLVIVIFVTYSFVRRFSGGRSGYHPMEEDKVQGF